MEKLQLLKTPEERQRRLEDIPEIHSDPNMDPSYESDEDDGETDDKRQGLVCFPVDFEHILVFYTIFNSNIASGTCRKLYETKRQWL